MHDPKRVEEEVAALGGLTLSRLRERWEALYGEAPPKALREGFLAKACAYKIQEKAYGGLSKSAKRRLRKIAEAVSAGKPVGVTAARRIKPGTRLVRAWGGTVHTVTVVAGGFEYAGTRYASLSAIARAITGTSWNGPAFFGLERPARGPQGPQEPRTGGEGGGDSSSTPRTGEDPRVPARDIAQMEDMDHV